MVKSHNYDFQNVEYLKLSKRSMLETGNTCKCLTLADEIFNIYKCLTLTTVKHFKPVEHLKLLGANPNVKERIKLICVPYYVINGKFKVVFTAPHSDQC